MRPARIIAAVMLTAAAAATGSYAAYSSSHRSAAASATTVAATTPATSPVATTTAPARVTTVAPGTARAACTSQAILPLLQRKFDSGELAIVRADIKRCRNGYAHVLAIPRPNPGSPSRSATRPAQRPEGLTNFAPRKRTPLPYTARQMEVPDPWRRGPT